MPHGVFIYIVGSAHLPPKVNTHTKQKCKKKILKEYIFLYPFFWGVIKAFSWGKHKQNCLFYSARGPPSLLLNIKIRPRLANTGKPLFTKHICNGVSTALFSKTTPPLM